MLQGQDILCISSIDWDFIWQGHQEIMTAFAAQGNRVLFIENTGVRAPTLKDFSRLRKRLLDWLHSTKGFRQERENLFVYSPLLLPFPYSRMARRLNRFLLLRALQRWGRATGFGQPIAWTFLPTPLARDVLRAVDAKVTVYYCIDDLASSSPAARRIRHSEDKLFREADLVFVTSEKLRQRVLQFTDRVHLFPFGVAFEQFERVREAQDGLPEDLRRLPRPMVGYVGGIHQWVDQTLLADVARQLPHVSFVFVGPTQIALGELRRCPNVHFLGPKPHDRVPSYIKGFDVGIIPYRLSDYTAHVYPTKLNEYLAMGIPVVATDLPEIRRFAAEHGPVVSVAEGAGKFVSAISEALRPGSAEQTQRRIEVSRQNGWQARIAAMSALIERELDARHSLGVRWQDSIRRLYRAARHRSLSLALGVGLLYLAIFQSGLIWWMAEPLRMTEPPRQADAIVIFAGGVGETGKVGGGSGYQERVKEAVDLYRAGMAPRMIFSSGYTFVFHETQVMRDLTLSLGVPPSAILLETHAANTFQNVAFVKAILDQRHWHSVLLVSSPYHMRRAVWTFRKIAPAITVIPVPVPASQFYIHDRGATFAQIRAIFHEYLAMLYYWWKGWM